MNQVDSVFATKEMFIFCSGFPGAFRLQPLHFFPSNHPLPNNLRTTLTLIGWRHYWLQSFPVLPHSSFFLPQGHFSLPTLSVPCLTLALLSDDCSVTDPARAAPFRGLHHITLPWISWGCPHNFWILTQKSLYSCSVAYIVLQLAMVPGEYLVCPFASVRPTIRVQSIPPASALVSPGLCHCPLLLGAVPPFR